jgi:hypothetical protein
MLSRNTVSTSLIPALSNLDPLLSLLQGFQITRFAVRPLPDKKATPELMARLAVFGQELEAFTLGESRTYGWPVDPQYMDCWSFNERVLEVVRERFLDWLAIVGAEVRWSFFRRNSLALDLLGDGSAIFTDLLAAEITELRLLGLACKVSDHSIQPHGDPGKDKLDREASWYFGPHLVLNDSYRSKQRPFWWTAQHDALILHQVKKEQWRWMASHRMFTKHLTKEQLDRHIAEWEQLCVEGREYAVWYNGLGAYITKRAIELGAPALVTTVPEIKLCAACCEKFHETSARVNYLGTEQVDICKPCIDEAVWRGQKDDFTTQETLNYLRELAAILGRVPESDYGRHAKTMLKGLNSTDRAAAIGRLRERPTLRLVNNQFGSWFNALKEAGVLDEGAQRQIMGTRCLAMDGHVCLSLAEKRIDDLLTTLGIVHQREVLYSGRHFRADFMVGETVIEYFGLMGRADYKAKAEKKERYCTEQKIPFLALYPEDVDDEKVLARKLKSFLQYPR